MSASLVGSEMCIRDRPSSMPSVDGWLTLASFAVAGTEGALDHPALLAAVSYTHLTLPTICSV
eukprot:3434873-Alexandrium_andersonii.AAC.1